jgi:hypothetical protein
MIITTNTAIIIGSNGNEEGEGEEEDEAVTFTETEFEDAVYLQLSWAVA